MNGPPFFPAEEYASRLQRVRQELADQQLDAGVFASPENIYYLTGLSHQGFFACHLLIVPVAGELALITRAMERVTIEAQVRNARFVGFADSESPVQVAQRVLAEMKLTNAQLGLEKDTLFLSPRVAEGLVAVLPQAGWHDISGLVDRLRLVKSERELAYMQQAAAVSDVMMQTALDTARAGISELEIAAELQRAMILAGGEYPGFGPFIRSTPRLGEEHTTWNRRVLQPGDALFVELAGCVARYHAPMGRLIFVDEAPPATLEIAPVCREAFQAVVAAIQPGVTAGQVYRAWQVRVDQAGLAHYRRHHCGYLVGIGFPPSWVGGNMVTGLRHDSELVLRPGMTFHLLSWLMGTGRGDYFVSDAAALLADGCTVLTSVPQQVHVV